MSFRSLFSPQSLSFFYFSLTVFSSFFLPYFLPFLHYFFSFSSSKKILSFHSRFFFLNRCLCFPHCFFLFFSFHTYVPSFFPPFTHPFFLLFTHLFFFSLKKKSCRFILFSPLSSNFFSHFFSFSFHTYKPSLFPHFIIFFLLLFTSLFLFFLKISCRFTPLFFNCCVSCFFLLFSSFFSFHTYKPFFFPPFARPVFLLFTHLCLFYPSKNPPVSFLFFSPLSRCLFFFFSHTVFFFFFPSIFLYLHSFLPLLILSPLPFTRFFLFFLKKKNLVVSFSQLFSLNRILSLFLSFFFCFPSILINFSSFLHSSFLTLPFFSSLVFSPSLFYLSFLSLALLHPSRHLLRHTFNYPT